MMNRIIRSATAARALSKIVSSSPYMTCRAFTLTTSTTTSTSFSSVLMKFNSSSNSTIMKFLNPLADVTTVLNDLIDRAIWYIKRTFQPSLIRRKRKHGFLSRIATNNGVKTLNRRRHKKRRYVSA